MSPKPRSSVVGAKPKPLPKPQKSYFGHMKGTVAINGDIVAPLDEVWTAASGDEDHLLKGPHKKKSRRGTKA